jgi:hypothetical protein
MIIDVDFFAGTSIHEAAQRAVEYSNYHSIYCRFTFNGIRIIVAPNSNTEEIVAIFLEECSTRQKHPIV